GLLGIAVAPDGDVLYVDHTEAGSGDIVVRAFPIAAGAVDPGGASELLRMVPRCGAHLGGQLLLDDEGNLLIGVGDGDGGRILNPSGSSQDETNLFGSILRVVPTVSAGEPYEIPPDNPFAGEGGEVREEIYVQGVRNPWRFALDPDTGDLWVADLGEDAFEELTLVPAAEIAGANLGWDFKEASRPFRNPDETPDDLIDPQYEYDRDDGCSIIGGVVAEDPALPAVEGGFVFGDLCTGVLRVAHADGGEVEVRSLGVAVPAVVSFGQDRAGRTYVLSLTGKLLRLDPPG
ncbi:MAG: PQQ-dependent sugar dehydrogenase, partial [Actinomycetota bacterium]